MTMSRGVKVQADLAIEACVDIAFDLIVVPGVRLSCFADQLPDKEMLLVILRVAFDSFIRGNQVRTICATRKCSLNFSGGRSTKESSTERSVRRLRSCFTRTVCSRAQRQGTRGSRSK